MKLKQKLGLGIGTAILSIGLVGGGTFAYFNDSDYTNNTFASGVLDLTVNPSIIINVDNIKPGDRFPRQFVLKNDGSLNISEVILSTSYEIIDAKGDNTDDFGKHILVHFLQNNDKDGFSGRQRIPNHIISSTTLYDLQTMNPDVVKSLPGSREASGLEAGDKDNLTVILEFVDNGGDQNQFQGDQLKLNWSFEAKQEAGEGR